MKGRTLWVFVLAVALALAVVAWWRRGSSVQRPAAPVARSTAKPKPEVPIQDGKTIDFSSGVPIVKDDAKEKAAIDRSVKAMEAAAKEVTFTPTAAASTPAPDDKKKAEPPMVPPKP